MNKCCTFFGHQIAPESCEEKIFNAVENLILCENVRKFYVNRHGKFDIMALSALRNLKHKYPDIEICVVFENANYKKDKFGRSKLDDYSDCEIVSFFIENTYFKAQIGETNKKMVEASDFVICWVDLSAKFRSGAQQAVLYAKKQNKTIINLY